MFQRGLEKPLLKWLEEEAEMDLVDTLANTSIDSIRCGFGEIAIEISRNKTVIIFRETYTEFFEGGASLAVREKKEPYTRASFRAALRRLKK